jgi:hypothetical protein
LQNAHSDLIEVEREHHRRSQRINELLKIYRSHPFVRKPLVSFAEGARAAKDIDIGVPVERAKSLRVFQDAVVLGFDNFTFLLRGKPLNIDRVDPFRMETRHQIPNPRLANHRSEPWSVR